MKNLRSISVILVATLTLLIILNACTSDKASNENLTSPDGNINLKFMLINGKPSYSVDYKKSAVIDNSALGYQFKDLPALTENFQIIDITRSSFDEKWETIWGSYSKIRNHYNEMEVLLREKDGLKREMTLVFRLYDDGVGFRYILPEQNNLTNFEIIDEVTQFNFPENNTAWWIIANYDSYEYTHVKSTVSEIGSKELAPLSGYGWPAFGKDTLGAANTPMTMVTHDNIYLSIHEAQLVDYAAMTLRNTSE